MALPQGTGAPGSAGANPDYTAGADPTNEPGQLHEGISGLGPADIAADRCAGVGGCAELRPAARTRSRTRSPGSFQTGTYTNDVVHDAVSGVNDWTQAIDGSYGGGPQLPGIEGNMPLGTGAGEGKVLHGGREVHG